MVITSAKLTRKHQITIPSEIRRSLDLQAGDVVYLALEDDRVELRAARGGWTESTRGLGAEMWRAEGGSEELVRKERESWR